MTVANDCGVGIETSGKPDLFVRPQSAFVGLRAGSHFEDSRRSTRPQRSGDAKRSRTPGIAFLRRRAWRIVGSRIAAVARKPQIASWSTLATRTGTCAYEKAGGGGDRLPELDANFTAISASAARTSGGAISAVSA
jgi:hypothetical protein